MRSELEDFAAEVFEPFARHDQRRWGQVYLRGLLTDGQRKSVEPMAARLGEDGNRQALAHCAAREVINGYHPVRAGELSAPGLVHRPVPADWRQLTDGWSTTTPHMVAIWRGDLARSAALRSGAMAVQGPEPLRRAVPGWFTLPPFASVPRPA